MARFFRSVVSPKGPGRSELATAGTYSWPTVACSYLPSQVTLFVPCLTISPPKILIDASKKDKTVREKQLEKEMLCSYVFSPLLVPGVVHAKCETSPLIRPPVKNITRNKNCAGISLLWPNRCILGTFSRENSNPTPSHPTSHTFRFPCYCSHQNTQRVVFGANT